MSDKGDAGSRLISAPGEWQKSAQIFVLSTGQISGYEAVLPGRYTVLDGENLTPRFFQYSILLQAGYYRMQEKTAKVTVRLPESEKDFLERRATDLGVSKSEILRRALSTYRSKTRPPQRVVLEPKSATFLQGVEEQISRVGVNLNQALFVAHATGLSDDALYELEQAIFEVKRLAELLVIRTQVRGGVTTIVDD